VIVARDPTLAAEPPEREGPNCVADPPAGEVVPRGAEPDRTAPPPLESPLPEVCFVVVAVAGVPDPPTVVTSLGPIVVDFGSVVVATDVASFGAVVATATVVVPFGTVVATGSVVVTFGTVVVTGSEVVTGTVVVTFGIAVVTGSEVVTGTVVVTFGTAVVTLVVTL
jgi:hypothetical protein